MNIGFLSTRLAGTDGVSLETEKWATILKNLGHRLFFCAGELNPDLHGMLVPEMHFTHPEIKWIHDRSFSQTGACPPDLQQRIDAMVPSLKDYIRRFVKAFDLDLLIAENVLAIPMNIPLGAALTEFIGDTDFPVVAHHHDFYWERTRFANNCVPEILERAFPPALPSIRHVVINRPAQESLRRQLGVDSVIIPNIFDFSRAAQGITGFSRDLRGALGLSEDHLMILQPTRVIRRKGIELSIELVRRLAEPDCRRRLLNKEPVLVITHKAGDEGSDYLLELQEHARRAQINMVYAATRFAPREQWVEQSKIYSLWDAYVQAQFVTYPSRYEGFGNALLESIYFRLPVLVNRYNVYVTDIAPLGFEFVEINGEITDAAVDQVITAIIDPVHRRRMVEYNYQVAMEHFSYEAVIPIVNRLIRNEVG
ncbi:MAG TPA: glycosyltransferase family 4 protein [Anaerolineaceae bacterium]|nr:glycosyltransferase family 4 protein [Anaerolineaceae bacterium]